MNKAIKATELHIYYGQLVHVIYAAKSEMIIQDGQVAFTKDQSITPPVTLVSYNPSSQEAEIRRTGSGPTEWVRPTQVWLA